MRNTTGLGRREPRGGGVKRVLIVVLVLGVVALLAAPMFVEPPAETRTIETPATIDFEAVLPRDR